MDFGDISVLLNLVGRGQAALAIHEKYKVPLVFIKQGHVARFYPDVPKVEINETFPKPVIAAYFVHEMHHVLRDKTGKSGDLVNQDEDDYVNTMVNEEIEGTIKQYAFYLELQGKGSFTKGVVPPVEFPRYESAYNYGRKLELETNPRATEEQQHKAGLVRGAMMTRAMIDHPDWRQRRLAGGGEGPVTISYRDMYRNEWRRAKAQRDKEQREKMEKMRKQAELVPG